MADIREYEPLWGSWRVDAPIGEGSFGKVYRVSREEFGRTYYAAVKILSIPQNEADLRQMRGEGLDEASAKSYFHTFVADIVQEIDLMNAFRGNSNVVNFEDHKVIEHTDGIGWDILIRMELLTSLTEHATEKPLTEDEVIKLGTHICRALELCALHNTIHRDIKPDNIFVSRYGEYKLGDFGIARQIERTMSGLSKKGTYTYMAPEVFKGDEYGASVDTYSLGIVMYRLLNKNRTPFLPDFPAAITPKSRDEALRRRMSGEPLPPLAGVDPSLTDIVLRACAYDRSARFASPTEMREALELVAGGGSYAYEAPARAEAGAGSAAAYAAYGAGEGTLGTEGTAGVFSGDAEATVDLEKTDGTQGVFAADFTEDAFREADKTEGTEGVFAAHAAAAEGEAPKPAGRRKRRRKIVAALLIVAVGIGLALYGGGGGNLASDETAGAGNAIDALSFAVSPDDAAALAEGASKWAKETVASAIEDGYVPASLYGDYTAPITRGAYSALATRYVEKRSGKTIAAFLIERDADIALAFSDTNDESVLAAASLGIMGGGGDGAFNPDATVTREAAAVCLTRIAVLFGADTSAPDMRFADKGKISKWAEDSVDFVASRKIMNGVGADLFAPKEAFSREQAIVTLYTLPEDLTALPQAEDDAQETPAEETEREIAPARTITAQAQTQAQSPAQTTPVQTQTPASDIRVSAVFVSHSSRTMNAGDNFGLTATVYPANAKNQAVSWSSSDSSVAAVSSAGLVSAKKAGSATITAKTSDGGHTSTCAVTVKEVESVSEVRVTSVSVSPASRTMNAGDSFGLAATVYPTNAKNQAVSWSSNDGSVAAVSSAGLVSAKKAGSATITAKTSDGGYTSTCVVTVKESEVKVTYIALSTDYLNLDVGVSHRLTATIYPANAKDTTVSWSSSDASVASVSGGTVTAKKAGNATITAKTNDGGHSANCVVTVVGEDKGVLVTDIFLDFDHLEVPVGTVQKLTAEIFPANAKDKSVSWSSSDASVASVSGGTVTAKKAGNATITAKTNDGGLTAVCSVTVIAVNPAPTASVSPASHTMNVGETVKLTVTISPKDTPGPSVIWTSGNEDIAAVAQDGTVTAKKAGVATIGVRVNYGYIDGFGGVIYAPDTVITVNEPPKPQKTVTHYECDISVSGNGVAFSNTYQSQTPYSGNNLPDFTQDLLKAAQNAGPGVYTISASVYSVYSDGSREMTDSASMEVPVGM
ncbi:MAG: Ig-like domain-containing protein [Clostridiales Family XIII bacterium]|jgi:uncharacterized protein YjdB|nr:Ig-like domain-containing protein [Clostridiales Family XIII bacterium]